MDQLQHKQVRLRKEASVSPRSSQALFANISRSSSSRSGVLTQQQAVTVIWIVFLPGWQTCFKCRGLWEVLLSPRSMVSGVALTLTWTEAGQLVFI